MIGQLLGVQPLLGQQTTKQAVLERLHSASLIHFAAHHDGNVASHADILRGSSHVPAPRTSASTRTHFRSPLFRDNQSAFIYCLTTSQWQLL